MLYVVPSWKPCFLVDWRPLIKEHMAIIGWLEDGFFLKKVWVIFGVWNLFWFVHFCEPAFCKPHLFWAWISLNKAILRYKTSKLLPKLSFVVTTNMKAVLKPSYYKFYDRVGQKWKFNYITYRILISEDTISKSLKNIMSWQFFLFIYLYFLAG